MSNLSKIKKVKGKIAEMSRACVDAEYRENGLVMRLLWAGLCEYVIKRKVVILNSGFNILTVKSSNTVTIYDISSFESSKILGTIIIYLFNNDTPSTSGYFCSSKGSRT